MKTSTAIFAATMFILLAGMASAETVIREKPLTWQDVAGMEGDALYANLCSACHGAGGKGDGPASGLLEKDVPDLTRFSAANQGVFPHKKVESDIFGYDRVSHGTIDMPAWGHQFMYLRFGWSAPLREAYARRQIHTLAKHIETLQG